MTAYRRIADIKNIRFTHILLLLCANSGHTVSFSGPPYELKYTKCPKGSYIPTIATQSGHSYVVAFWSASRGRRVQH